MTDPYVQRDISVGLSGLPGILTVPHESHGVIIFAHGSGSSRFSPRNTHVAQHLNSKGFATLLSDLLTDEEAADRANVFDIPLLGSRVLDAVEWVSGREDLAAFPLGIFGASTGAAAALVAAAGAPALVRAVVSRGGRPDLAGASLPHVEAPTLLIVGQNDHEVIALNREAQSRMRCTTSLVIIPGATHLFEEPGTLDLVVQTASGWFGEYLAAAED